MNLCICAFVHLCICAFVNLSLLLSAASVLGVIQNCYYCVCCRYSSDRDIDGGDNGKYSYKCIPTTAQ